MNRIQISLAVVIAIGLCLLITQKLWVPKAVDNTSAHEKTIVAEAFGTDGSACHQDARHMVIERSREGVEGLDILVKYKKSASEVLPCAYKVESGDFELLNQDATYFFTFTDNFLVLDSGTAPSFRSLVAYDLRNRQKVFTDSYARPFSVSGDTLTYWSLVETKVTEKNCPNIAQYSEQGLSAVIENNVSVNLATLTKTVLPGTRCSAVQ